ncbi:hypothetical protein BJ875DRAFT_468022 [Amylocarpus encephaloides]|uniref:Uncharacterized protein n=1 Tax=Amylocarpus encephaloides TaxID=45428 RepID=A0A9P8C3D8_9HELO|nr:hypothetical protein BJ875DRAFT_468022 [Amylocarpus encephaloides]
MTRHKCAPLMGRILQRFFLAHLQYYQILGPFFDGKILGKVPVETAILKFNASKPINMLETFPLHHHKETKAVIENLVGCGQRFCSLMGTRHRQYNGRAFQMKKGKPIRITIKGRIMVDPVKF